jgi:ABC-type phosphate/phosphonate transport system substrate-binding protein
MKRFLVSLGVLLLALALLPATSGMAAEKLIKGNLRIVIGSKSTGGDTYQNSSIVAKALAKKLDINVKTAWPCSSACMWAEYPEDWFRPFF